MHQFIFIYYIFIFTQTIKATSPLGDPRVTYNLADGMVPETNMPVRFYLTPNREDGSASILVAEPLDYETTRNFMLRVRAQNVAAVPLAAFTTVYVNITGERLVFTALPLPFKLEFCLWTSVFIDGLIRVFPFFSLYKWFQLVIPHC